MKATIQPPDDICLPGDSYKSLPDLEAFDDETPAAENRDSRPGQNALREVERRAETRWLRQQLADWDDDFLTV